jgi:hypothetical protein
VVGFGYLALDARHDSDFFNQSISLFGNEDVDRSAAVAAAISAGKEVFLPAQRDRRQCSLRRVVVDLDAPIVAIPYQRLPSRERLLDRLGELGKSFSASAIYRTQAIAAARQSPWDAIGVRLLAFFRWAPAFLYAHPAAIRLHRPSGCG